MQALTRFLQLSIEIARYEINNGLDVVITKFSDNVFVKSIPWSKEDRNRHVLNIADRNAEIDEFERLQLKMINSYDKRFESKIKTMQISKASGRFFLHYMSKVEHASYIISDDKKGMEYINVVAQTQANVILQNLI